MPKQNIKNMIGVLASVFAHTGKISKEEAKEMAGVDDKEFESLYAKASNIVSKLEKYEKVEDRYDNFAKHLQEEIDEFVKKFGPFDMGL